MLNKSLAIAILAASILAIFASGCNNCTSTSDAGSGVQPTCAEGGEGESR